MLDQLQKMYFSSYNDMELDNYREQKYMYIIIHLIRDHISVCIIIYKPCHIKSSLQCLHRGSYMSARVLLNLLYELICLILFFTSTQQSFSYAGRSSWVEPVLS